MCRTELTADECWCIMYCGAVPQVQKTLKEAAKKSKFHYAEESFNW